MTSGAQADGLTAANRDLRSALHERVDAFARYAELATAQLAALDQGDLERCTLLAVERDEVAAEIDAGEDLRALVEASLSDRAAPPTADSHSGVVTYHSASATTSALAPTAEIAIDTLLARARAELARGAEATRAVERSLQTLREDTRHAIHDLESRGRALRQYLETDGAPAGDLDISL
jgi:hypothetical protein